MHALIEQLTHRLGLPADRAEAASGVVLQAVRDQASPRDFEALLGHVPEAQDWMSRATALLGASASEPGGGGGGLLGAARGGLGGVLGGLGGAAGEAGKLGGLMALLNRAGLDSTMALELVPLVLQFLRSRAGAELMGRLTAAVPMLQPFLGTAGSESASDPGLGRVLGKLF